MRTIELLPAAAFLLVGLAACAPKPQMVEKSITVGDQSALIRVAQKDALHWWTVQEIVQRTMKRVQETLDAHHPESDLSRINRVGSSSRIQIARDTYRLLDLAQLAAEQTGGAYDFTIAPVAYLWGFEGGAIPTNEPSADMIQATRVGVGARNVVLYEFGAAALTQPQTKLSVDSLVDAYATDLAVVAVRDKEIENALVSIGLSARALGVQEGARSWQMAIPDPMTTNTSLGMARLEGGLALSQVMPGQKSVTIGGRKFGHIIDPRTGRPAVGVVLAVAAGPTATQGSVLAQAAVVLGERNCGSLLAAFPRYELLVVPDRQPMELWMTKGFRALLDLRSGLEKNVHEIDRPAPVTDAERRPSPSPSAPGQSPAAR